MRSLGRQCPESKAWERFQAYNALYFSSEPLNPKATCFRSRTRIRVHVRHFIVVESNKNNDRIRRSRDIASLRSAITVAKLTSSVGA
jgi:hypothetical protein